MKRFYRTVSVGEAPGGFAVMLDGKPVRTPRKLPFAVDAGVGHLKAALRDVGAEVADADGADQLVLADPGYEIGELVFGRLAGLLMLALVHPIGITGLVHRDLWQGVPAAGDLIQQPVYELLSFPL